MPDERSNVFRLSEIAKNFGAALTPIVVAVLGLYINRSIEKQEQAATNRQLYTTIMSNREEAECTLRKDMFAQIINSFFGEDPSTDPAEWILNLELLGYNFHESLNLKPLTTHVDHAIRTDATIDSLHKKALGERLDELILTIKQYQGHVLAMYGMKKDLELTLRERGLPKAAIKNLASWPEEMEGLTLDSTLYRSFDLSLDTIDMINNKVKINLKTCPLKKRKPAPFYAKPWYNDSLIRDDEKRMSIEMNVNNYDLPMITNVRLSNNERIAVTLKSLGPKKAFVTFYYFRGEYGSVRDRAFYQDIIKSLNF